MMFQAIEDTSMPAVRQFALKLELSEFRPKTTSRDLSFTAIRSFYMVQENIPFHD